MNITPSKDDLTEDNLEQIPDASNPAPTATAASTAASSWDPRNASTTGTPYSLQHGQPQAIRPPTSGFQASALKATGTSGRTPSYQRRVLDQEEAVRMPGNREVDRATVQFGAFNLSGNGEEDVDGEREEPETRAQPPQHSPVAPRAALPPALQPPVTASEGFPTPKQSAGLPAASHPTGKSFIYSTMGASLTLLQLPQDYHPLHPFRVPRVPSRDLKEIPPTTSTGDMDKVPKSPLHCLKSHMMLLASKRHRLKAPSKAILVNKLQLSHNNSPELSHPHQSSSPLTIRRIRNNAMRITATTSNSTVCSKVRRASRMVPVPNDHSVVTTVLKLRELLRSHRAQLNRPHLVMQRQVVKEVDTTHLTRLPRPSSKEPAKIKEPNLSNQAIPNSLKLAITLMAIPTTPAHTMLRI